MSNRCGIILAAGEGVRMKSNKPKTLCEVLHKPMLRYVIDAMVHGDVQNICVVTGYKKEYIETYLQELPFSVSTVVQSERLGTGHAVMMAEDFLRQVDGDVIILGGDAPFMDSETIQQSYLQHKENGASVTVISANVENPKGYGRIVRDAESGALSAIVEQKDANEEIQKIKEVNSGGYWFKIKDLLAVLHKITSDNAGNEYYLPDAIKLLISDGKIAQVFAAESADTVLGANTPEELEELNEIAKRKFQ
ncbi:MAG: sugar phosphate nucleotidyltransferase [Bacillota bacterium]|nr:sugar phosphate nucleotidyltransferase [Bacillota bacterium]